MCNFINCNSESLMCFCNWNVAMLRSILQLLKKYSMWGKSGLLVQRTCMCNVFLLLFFISRIAYIFDTTHRNTLATQESKSYHIICQFFCCGYVFVCELHWLATSVLFMLFCAFSRKKHHIVFSISMEWNCSLIFVLTLHNSMNRTHACMFSLEKK